MIIVGPVYELNTQQSIGVDGILRNDIAGSRISGRGAVRRHHPLRAIKRNGVPSSSSGPPDHIVTGKLKEQDTLITIAKGIDPSRVGADQIALHEIPIGRHPPGPTKSTPVSLLPEMRFPAPGTVPPTMFPDAATIWTPLKLGMGAVPVAFVPM